MIDISKLIDVFLGEEFLKLAGVPGGFFYYVKESQVAVLFLTDLGFLCSPVVI